MTCALPLTPLSLAAAFAAGIASSLHCVTMCGGIAAALSVRARASSSTRAMMLRQQVVNQIGRIGAYGVLGAMVGLFGQTLARTLDRWHIVSALRIMAALVMVLLALQILLKVPLLQILQRAGGFAWRYFAPRAAVARAGGIGGNLLFGAVWGLMPCGLVYSMLSVSALSASPLSGAGLMLMFGVGTLPALLGGHLIAVTLGPKPGLLLSRLAGLLVLAFGIWTAYTAVLA